jgi:hypothetical protein
MFYNSRGIPKIIPNSTNSNSNIDISLGTSSNRIIRRKPDYLSLFNIPQSVINQTKEFMIKMGKKQKEGLVFWSGNFENDIANIRTVINPHNVSSAISAQTNNKGLEQIFDVLRKNNEFLFIQVHSHPASAFHSSIDCNEAISFKKGFISIVVPFYGNDMEDMYSWAIFEYTSSSTWRQLGNAEILKRFKVI